MRARLVPAAFIFAVLAASATFAFAQAGSTGGTIGKHGKSVSGGEEAAPPRQRVAPKPRQTKRAAPAEAESRRARASFSVTGRWRWNANCERGQGRYTGILIFEQSGQAFTGSHGGTNLWDSGTIANGRVNGNRVSFDRIWGRYNDHVTLTLSGAGSALRMAGILPNTAHSGRCELAFMKN